MKYVIYFKGEMYTDIHVYIYIYIYIFQKIIVEYQYIDII